MVVPQGWFGCPKQGTDFAGGIFFCFKTPLSNKFDTAIRDPAERWSTKHVLNAAQDMKKPLGLWIDLTFTDRYFPYMELTRHDPALEYFKLKIGGHGVEPSRHDVSQFIARCQAFLSKRPHSSIGVHCTHGFNRTGYLVVEYLVQVSRLSVLEAIAEFTRCRPLGIYRQNYVDVLCRKYGHPGIERPAVTEPQWALSPKNKHTPDQHQASTNNSNGSTASANIITQERASEKRKLLKHKLKRRPSQKKRRRLANNAAGAGMSDSSNNDEECEDESRVIVRPTFYGNNSRSANIHPITDLRLKQVVLNDIRKMCNDSGGGDFPGTRAEELKLGHLAHIRDYDQVYFSSGSSVRYLLLIKCAGQIFLLDTLGNVFQAHNLTFPSNNRLVHHLHDTLLDGEMELVRDGSGSTSSVTYVPKYSVTDVILMNGFSIGTRTALQNRLACIQYDILAPRSRALQRRQLNYHNESKFQVQLKPYHNLHQLQHLLQQQPTTTLKLKNTTLPYFTPELSWSLVDVATCNFGVRVDRAKSLVHLYVSEYSDPAFRSVRLTEEELEKVEKGRVGEFRYERARREWSFVGEKRESWECAGSEARATSLMMDEDEPRLSQSQLLSSVAHLSH